MNLFRTKSIELMKAEAELKPLKKSLGAVDLVLLGIGCIIGTGIFVLTGIAAAKYAGPGLMLSFVLSGTACVFAALAYAELASVMPIAGGAYTYTYAALGEIVAWIVGWALILEYTVAVAAVGAGWSAYFVGLLKTGGIVLPQSLTAVPADGGIVNLPGVVIVLILSLLLMRGTKESATFNRILVFVKLVAVFIFLLLAGPKVNTANWVPFMPFGFSGVVSGAAIIFFAYIGFDAVATTAEECRKPQRDLPIGIIGSLLICTFLYILVSATLTGAVHYTQLNNAEPVAYVLRILGYNFGSALVATGAMAGITTVLLVLMFGQSRIFFAMSRDGLIPAEICKIHPVWGTPYIVTGAAGVVVALIIGFTPIGIIAELTNIGTLFAFVVASIGVLVLRYKLPDVKRPFRCPAVQIVAPLSVLFCGTLMVALSNATWIRFAIWMTIGLVVYFFYGCRKSKMQTAASEVVKGQ